MEDETMTFEDILSVPPKENHIDFYYKKKELKVSYHFDELTFSINEYGEKMGIGQYQSLQKIQEDINDAWTEDLSNIELGESGF